MKTCTDCTNYKVCYMVSGFLDQSGIREHFRLLCISKDRALFERKDMEGTG